MLIIRVVSVCCRDGFLEKVVFDGGGVGDWFDMVNLIRVVILMMKGKGIVKKNKV